jgi:hypothetical protein
MQILKLTYDGSNILSLPFRRSQPVSLAAAMKPYILGKYGQHPDMFMADFNAIDKLRTEAINVQEAHSSGIKKLTVYAAQLQWIGGKFPVDVSLSDFCKHLDAQESRAIDPSYSLAWTFHGFPR